MARTFGPGELSRSKINERHADPDSGAPYTIHLDELLTRRKRFHQISDREGGIVYRSKFVGDIFEWLARHDQFAYTVRGEGLAWFCRMERMMQDEGDLN